MRSCGGKKRIIDLDLKAYFDSVQHSVLLSKVARRVQDPDVLRLLKLILKSTGKQGVPQGGVISPVLSNLYLNEVDRMLEKAIEKQFRLHKSYNLRCEDDRRAECGKTACSVRRGGGWRRTHGRASEALPEETGSNRQAGPTESRRQSSTLPQPHAEGMERVCPSRIPRGNQRKLTPARIGGHLHDSIPVPRTNPAAKRKTLLICSVGRALIA